MEYNTNRESLRIPEYGRHVHNMVQHCLTIEDRKKRNETAEALIDVMGVLNPHLRDVPDFQHKLWDQLFIMSDYQLDVDSPFPKPIREEIDQKPEKMKYPSVNYKYKYYGNNIINMIGKAIDWEEGDKKDALIYVIANHMKKCYLNWNKDTVEDQVIFNHLSDISGGKINLSSEDETLTPTEKLLTTTKRQSNKKKNRK